ncbi:class I SAM-dependent DNA methyltransferase [Streptomyces ipomoeae]|uniref:Methyltransferase domain protein n=1 Tax=Streptomyces ipomoeae 91-03 TaxID=698759 RepID=L1KJ82_9ACTN|nr:class I SAM-dependent methyltransferase [Streptomyces ipomoeae]EKX60624.1 methyltransferase domain protein [Streptomyces ipomoeae 91-03]MDX2698694.1 class I SAM-dependent methyltransferase [Streptomyces ipomoeae]MDX2844376.1 class I SAM-dependent methyltransferase [Streptomyces ipomoeae]
MFTDIAPFYDLVKSHRNHDAEAASIRSLIQQHAPQAKTILEVACGTGTLLARLNGYERIGVDVSEAMLHQARKKLGDEVVLVPGKMQDFQLPRSGAEVLLLLDGAIGYVGPAELEPTLSTFAGHLVSGGLLVVEPWYTPDEWQPKKIHVTHHTDNAVTVVRAGYGHPCGRIDFHVTIGTSAGLHAFDERYDFTLHFEDVMEAAFTAAGFVEVRKEAAPEFRRGLWVARKP